MSERVAPSLCPCPPGRSSQGRCWVWGSPQQSRLTCSSLGSSSTVAAPRGSPTRVALTGCEQSKGGGELRSSHGPAAPSSGSSRRRWGSATAACTIAPARTVVTYTGWLQLLASALDRSSSGGSRAHQKRSRGQGHTEGWGLMVRGVQIPQFSV